MKGHASLDRVLARLRSDPEDQGAWAELYEQLWPLVFTVAFRRLRGTRALAEDAAQDVFLRLVRARPFQDLRDGETLRAYVWRVAENTATDYLKRALGSRAAEDSTGSVEPQVDATSVELATLLDEARRSLADIDQRILSFMVEGRDLSEIAAATGLSYSNVGVRIHRLRRSLRNMLLRKGL